MQPLPNLRRATVLAIAAGTLCSCTGTTKSGSGSGLPSLSAVAGVRFVSQVVLDDGGLVVDPAGMITPHVPANIAQAMFRATDMVARSYRFAVFGLGNVTVSTQVRTSPTTGPDTSTTTPTTSAGTTPTSTTTTTPSTTSTATSSSTTLGGTATGRASTSTATTGAGSEPGVTASTATTGPPPQATAALPVYQGRLAWVGIAWDIGCPPGPSGSRAVSRYVAVVFDAETGRSALGYTSRGAKTCNGPVQPASVSLPDELVSIAWQPVGPASTAVRVTVPACGTYYGWTEVAASGTDSIQVVARVPFDPVCTSKGPITETVDDVVPVGSKQAGLPHALIGPVDALRTLPGA